MGATAPQRAGRLTCPRRIAGCGETMSSDHSDDRDVVAEYDADEDGMKPNPREQGKWISGLVALIGAWMIAAPFVFETIWPAQFELLEAHFWSDVIVGLALLVLGGYNYYRRSDERLANSGVAMLIALLGLWMIATPFVFGIEGADVGMDVLADGDLMAWNDVLLGLVVFLLGAYSAYEARDTGTTRPART